MLQHPLGVAVLPDGSIAIADTYNGAVRRFADGALTTIATDLSEPSGLYVDGRDLVVVESAAHRLTRIPLDVRVAADDFSHTTQRPVTEVAATLRLEVPFTPPPGQKVDDRFGLSSQLLVTSTPPGLIRSGEGRGTDLTRELVLDPHVGDASCTSPPAPPPATPVPGKEAVKAPPATCTSRTGVSRSGSAPAGTSSSPCLWAAPSERPPSLSDGLVGSYQFPGFRGLPGGGR